ncbi:MULTISPECIES: hypothetical protein [unclassified Archaeoglobus]|uniref:hypothetical protein n=1 Tax=unclassified Archaeoglobus TaxID=2643606 RepID=UPI0025BFF42E|nr:MULTISPECIES: hypothetical protein [unclassified Archaeoglobus]
MIAIGMPLSRIKTEAVSVPECCHFIAVQNCASDGDRERVAGLKSLIIYHLTLLR